MTVGRSSLLNLFSQARTGGSRNAISTTSGQDSSSITVLQWSSRTLQTLAVVPYHDASAAAFFAEGNAISVPDQQAFFSNNFGDAFEALDDLRRLSTRRARFLQTISTLYMSRMSRPRQREAIGMVPGTRKPQTTLADVPPEASAAVIPHERFCDLLRSATDGSVIRKVLRAQLLRCTRPSELLRIVAVALQEDKFARNLAILEEPITRAVYRCRGTATDVVVLNALNAIVSRLRQAKLNVPPKLVFLSARFAARTRNLPAIKKTLRAIREGNLAMTSNIFCAIIAKCSIGYRGFGEIRNGRWRRSELLQVLKGFDDCHHLPPHQQYHLKTFMDRSDWGYIQSYIVALSRCRDSESVKEEWESWLSNPIRRRPGTVSTPGEKDRAEGRPSILNSQPPVRGDKWFIEQAAYSGDLRLAWLILSESEVQYSDVRPDTRHRLLEGLQFCPKELWSSEIRGDLIVKYDRDLQAIESALGVKWVSHGSSSIVQDDMQSDRATRDNTAEEDLGYHEVVEDLESALERLASDDFQIRPDFGYPWESEPPLQVPVPNPAAVRTQYRWNLFS